MNDTFIDSGLIYGFKPGGNCEECCFMIGEENTCVGPHNLPFPCSGSYFEICEIPKYGDYCSPIYLTEDQVSTVLDALEVYRHFVTDADVNERIISCLTVFENI